MRTQKIEPFGVEITDFQIDSVTPDNIDRLKEDIARDRIAVFRAQYAGDDVFVRFLKLFGEMTFTQGEIPVVGAGDLNVVSNVGRTTPPRSVFHTDTSYIMRPPAFTALRVVQVPRIGGATEFSDQVQALRSIPFRYQNALSGRTVRHAFSTSAVRHPLFRRHPITDEVALFLSTPERCTALSDVDEISSTRILAALYRHSTRPDRLYRHQWQAGDIVVWDNRVTMHRANHQGVSGDRILHRGMVSGEIPIAA